MDRIPWIPVSEYRPEYGTVIVWLEWPQYNRDRNRMERSGTHVNAYQIATASGVVWVTAHDSIPCETTGRKATHFLRVTEPTDDAR